MTVAPTSVHPGGEQHRLRWIAAAILVFLSGVLVGALLYRSDVFGASPTSGAEGSGVPATQARAVAAFDGVELAGGNNVAIHVGGEQSVVVKADDNLLDRVTTEVRAKTLVIGSTPGSFTTKSPMSVEVTVPTLAALRLAGRGNLVVDGIDADSLEVTLPGSGTVTGSGTATRLHVTVGGSGTVRFTDVVANEVQALVSGSGAIFVTATERLDASVSGSGAIFYAGHPQVKKNVTGSGVITGG